MLTHISCQHTVNENSLGPFSHLWIVQCRYNVQLGIVTKNSKQSRDIHIFQHALIVVFLSPLCIELNLKQVIGALMIEVVTDCSKHCTKYLE
jgi:hypothetical protein